jgi:hypothetical protein
MNRRLFLRHALAGASALAVAPSLLRAILNAAAPSLRDDDASIRNFGSLDMLGGKGLLV